MKIRGNARRVQIQPFKILYVRQMVLSSIPVFYVFLSLCLRNQRPSKMN